MELVDKILKLIVYMPLTHQSEVRQSKMAAMASQAILVSIYAVYNIKISAKKSVYPYSACGHTVLPF